jgi:lysyl-tRNA synthetase class 2
VDTDEMFADLGIPAEWIEVIRKVGYNKVNILKEAKPGKLFQDICGFNKKNKLGLTNPSQDDVKAWIA